MDVNRELCQYLRDRDFDDFMQLWKKQYEKYGTCAGAIHVPLTASNQLFLEGLLGKDFHKNSHAIIRRSQLNKALNQTKFAGVDFDKVLHLYFDEEIITKKETKVLKKEKENAFLNKLIHNCRNQHSCLWLSDVIENQKYISSYILQEFHKSPSKCEKQVQYVLDAIDEFPIWRQSKENLSIFSSRITKDPHTFDHTGFCRTLFLNAISYFFPSIDKNKEIDVLYSVGLYKEAMSNYCGIVRLNAIDKEGKIHDGWKGFYDRYEEWNVNLDNLLNITSLSSDLIRIVCVLENPSVFHRLASLIKHNNITSVALVCTYGQLNYASYLIMDYLSQTDFTIYYSGDMDPEGLLIAQKIKERYPNVFLWHYEIEDYYLSCSEKKSSEKRLKMLEKLNEPKLRAIGQCIIGTCGKSGYQENIIQKYERDFLAYLSKLSS